MTPSSTCENRDLADTYLLVITQLSQYRVFLIDGQFIIQMQGSKAQILNCGNECVESFKAHRTQTQLRQLSLPNFYSTAANNSGPIALLYQKYNTKQIKLPQTYDTNIIIFNCRGELIRTIPFDLKQRIIVFEFTIDQNLLIVYATGVYFMVDIATAAIEQRHFLSEQEIKGKNRFTGGQMIADKTILQREKTIGIVQGLDAKWKALTTVRFHSEFPVFECNSITNEDPIYKRETDIEICYLNANCEIETSVIRGKEKVGSSTVIYSHPELRTLAPLLISLTHKNGFLVMVFTDFVLLINTNEQKSQKSIEAPSVAKSSIEGVKQKSSSSNSQKIVVNQNGTLTENSFQILKKAFKEKILFFKKFRVERDNLLSKSSSGLKYRKFYKMGWLKNVCFFSDGKKLMLFTLLEPQLKQVPVTESSFLLSSCQKILRVIDQNTYVLRVINNPIYYYLADQSQAENKCYKNADAAFQQKYNTFRNMLLIYENFVQKKPNSISELKRHQEQAEEVWQELMSVVQLAMDPGLQLKILKVASWIHSMFGMAKEGRELLSRLRVINGLKYEHWNRWLSYEQFQGLKSTRFLTMLLKSNMHYVADLIFQDSESKKVIFLHWAKCKIQKQTPSTALDQIKQRYNDMKTDLQSKYVFNQLALYCLHREQSLPDLAIKLAESQTHPVRKCMVFLLVFKKKHSLDLIDKLLEFAESSFNNNIIHQTLSTLRNLRDEVPDTAWLQLLPKKPFLQAFYLRMLRSEYNQEEIQRYMQVNKFYTDLAYLSLKNYLRQINNTSLEAVVPILQRDYAKILPTLTQQVSRSQPCKGIAKLRELKQKSSPISQSDAELFNKDQQFQALGELMAVKDKNMALAVRVFKKIKSQKVYQILRVKGKLKDAIEVAFQRKNKLKLQELVVELGGDDDDSTYGRQLLKELNQTM